MNRQYIIFGVVGLVILIVAVFFVFGVGRNPAPPAPVSLTFWGFGDDEEVWRPVLEAFQKQYAYITIKYQRFDAGSYEKTLVNRLAEGNGPDVFLLKNSWLAKERDKIFPLPAVSSPLSFAQFQTIFADGADALVARDGSLFGLPLFMDSLALFYNKDVFDAAGIAAPPKTWEDVVTLSRKFTKIAPSGDVVTSGVALGSARNIPHALELISSLMLQKGEVIARPDGHMELGAGAEAALTFYTSFGDSSNQNFSWNSRMGDAFDAFAEGNLAMTFGFSDDIEKIRIKNPHLNFGVAPLPQFTGGSARTYGAYVFPTVSRLSQNQIAAWQFVFFATSHDANQLYLKASHRPPVRRDLITAAGQAGEAGIFASQALISRDWPIPDEDATRRIFNDAIDAVQARSSTSAQALGKIREQMQLLFP